MGFLSILEKKRNGHELTTKEIRVFVEGVTNGTIPDYQISAFLMAVYFNKMTSRETADLTLAMAQSGDQFDLSSINGLKVDKHSTGGVGDKTTLIVAPLVAACGVKVAKMSGKGLGHTGGTLDKLASYNDIRLECTQEEFIHQVNTINLAIIGQSGDITPADKRLYALRDVTATVDSIPLIASSVMSKKIASGSDVIALDVKVGDGAFMKTIDEAKELAEVMVDIGRSLGRQVIAFITNMDQPLGYKIGNAVEVEEVIATLQNNGPEDLTELSLQLASYLVFRSRVAATLESAREEVELALKNGHGLQKFYEFLTYQGANLEKPIFIAQKKTPVFAQQRGYITRIKAEDIGLAAMCLGAGRETKDDEIDTSVGVELCLKVGDKVDMKTPIAYIYSNGIGENKAQHFIQNAYEINPLPVEKPMLIYEIIE